MELEKRDKIIWKNELGFILLHFTPLFMIQTGSTKSDWIICAVLYFARMFFITGGYHRYFAHKTYKTSRFVQFLIACGAQSSVQKGALWWASKHRVHHKHSDTPADPHSKKWYGFFYSHIGWILSPQYKKTNYDGIKDFAKFPELVWLNKFHMMPAIVLMIAVLFVGGYLNGGDSFMSIIDNGWSSVVVGFLTSTVLLFHGTFTINSLTHMIGSKRYESNDESRNHFLLAIITMGEGWHNNHHYYQSTVRQGFFWWEWDPTFYILKMMSWVGLVWDLRPVPKHIKYSKNMEHAKELAKQYATK